jgi:hypothetical protein
VPGAHALSATLLFGSFFALYHAFCFLTHYYIHSLRSLFTRPSLLGGKWGLGLQATQAVESGMLTEL